MFCQKHMEFGSDQTDQECLHKSVCMLSKGLLSSILHWERKEKKNLSSRFKDIIFKLSYWMALKKNPNYLF